MNGSENGSNDCATYPSPFLETQFYLVSVFGAALALVGLASNCLLAYVFMSRAGFRKRHYFYLTALAMVDAGHCICYILVFSLCIAYEYLHLLALMRVWYGYVVPVFTICHVLRLTGTWILVSVSIERYFSANFFSAFCTLTKRFLLLAGSLFLGVIFRGTMLLEFRVRSRPQCPGLASYILEPTAFYLSQFGLIWTVFVRNIASVLVPFFLLLVVNFGIVYRDRCQCILVEEDVAMPIQTHVTSMEESASAVRLRFQPSLRSPSRMKEAPSKKTLTGQWVSRAREKVQRSATRTLIALTTTYLLSSLLSVVIVVWEYVDSEGLNNDHYYFYTMASDFISLLALLTSSCRLFIYVCTDLKFRQEMLWVVCSREYIKKRRQQRRSQAQSSSGTNFRDIVLAALDEHRRQSSATPPRLLQPPAAHPRSSSLPEDKLLLTPLLSETPSPPTRPFFRLA